MSLPQLTPAKSQALRRGLVIPAHPLALTAQRRLDERRQRALSRYYLAAGAGGLAVAVHTTQFAIRDPKIGLHRPVLEIAAETARETAREAARLAAHQTVPEIAGAAARVTRSVSALAIATARVATPQPTNGSTGSPSTLPTAPAVALPNGGPPLSGDGVLMIAGVCGRTEQALAEACLAADLGYDLLLVQLGAFQGASEEVLLEHCRRLAEVRPLFGFYLQPSVGGRLLGYSFWRRFAEIENTVAIKIAPFNRYQTLDVIRGVADSGRSEQIALYTGNDDHILLDLLTPFPLAGNSAPLHIVGGLLGHWAVWAQRAVEHLRTAHAVSDGQAPLTPQLLALANEITAANAAIFDPEHAFTGCIPGIHEVLRRQGLLAGRWCLDPDEALSSGQMDEIDRVYQQYPHLHDDTFVAEHLNRWLS